MDRLALASLDFSGAPGDLASGQWAVAAVVDNESGSISGASAVQLTKVSEHESSFTLTLAGDDPLPANSTLYGDFAHDLRPSGHDRNETPLAAPADPAAAQQTITLALDTVPAALVRGRLLIVQGATSAELVTVVEVVPGKATATLVFKPPLQGRFRKHETVLLGNVVPAGHGESQPTKTLGSGDATQTSQEMICKVTEVSFVPNPAMSSGVAAAIDVIVDGQRWTQVAALYDSAAEDSHYEVRLTEDGLLAIRFGDGVHGRRLPTGRGNVRITSRTGVGLAGNLPPANLVKEVVPHPLVKAIAQPLPAAGGNDLEDVASLRSNAPASVLALERAVSLSDFSALAMSNSAVWQARAQHLTSSTGSHESVRVAVVPAGGGSLGTLASEISAFLQRHTLPGVTVSVVDFRPVPLDLVVSAQVKSAEFDPVEVVANVRELLLDTFSLRNRKLGAPLYRSEIFAVVESVRGVENCTCQLTVHDPVRTIATGPDGAVRNIRIDDDQLLFLDPERSALKIEALEFAL